ncbi:MAG: hypothetical protein EBZ77_17575, partial [Chitinophagia bacterium]|nr:hypothetical protein [Chitinophagia bacterium]
RDTLITLLSPARLGTYISLRQPACAAVPDGAVTLTAYGTAAPYSYAVGTTGWGSSGTFSGFAAGRDTFHIRDGRGCVLDTIITFRDSSTLQLGLTFAPIACNGDSTVLHLIGRSGFGGPYSYAVGSSVFAAYDTLLLPAGPYTLHVRDSAGCLHDTTLTLRQPPILRVNIASVTQVQCFGAADGAITLYATGGTPGYRYTTDGATFGAASVFTGLDTGTYLLAVRDTNSCTDTALITLTQPRRLAFDSVVFSGPVCYADTNGYIRVTATGGTASYLFALNSGVYGTARTFSHLLAGLDTVHLKDAHGCLADTVLSLTRPPRLTPSVALTRPLCHTFGNGFIAVTGSGGLPGYRFAVGSGT